MEDEALLAELDEAQRVGRAHLRLLELIREADDRELWRDDGARDLVSELSARLRAV